VAKSKYTPNRITKILHAISESGKDKDGIKAGGIHADTFYEWLKIHPEFPEAVAHAKEVFAAKAYRTDPELHLKAVAGLRKLVEGYEETHSSITEVTDHKGKLKTKIKKAGKWRRPPNRSAIEFLLAHRPELEDALPETVDFEFDVIPPDDSGPDES